MNVPAAKLKKSTFRFYKLVRSVLLIIYRVSFRFKHYGSANVPADERGVILAANHASFLDPPALGLPLTRHVTYLAKEYLFNVFVLGTALRWLGCLPIKSDRNDDFKSIRQLLRMLELGRCIVVFPEGTRSLDGNLKDVEGGVGFLAVKSKAWVVPIYIRGTFDALPRGGKFFKCRPVEVHFGKAFIPALDESLKGHENHYLAVSRKIMDDIRNIKKAVEEKV